MSTLSRLRAATLLIGCPITAYAAIPQTATPPATTTQQPNQTKPAPRPNPDASGICHAGDGVIAPKLIYPVAPEFSEKARKHKISGDVIVQALVDTEGHVQDARVFRSAAEDFTNKKDRELASTLDPKAIEAVRQYRFEPGTFHGKPVPVELNVEVNFQVF
jgi:TonB family protein